MILVTGGTGLVGAHLLYNLTQQNQPVKAIYRNENKREQVKEIFSYYTDNYSLLFDKIKWIKADITDLMSLDEAFYEVTTVYHVAAFISFNPADYWKMRKINIEGTANVVNLCIDKKVKKLCFFSSIATLDKALNKKYVNESSEWISNKNKSGYAITKHGAEMEVWRGSQEGLHVVILNPGIILGPGFYNQGSGKLFSTIYKGFPFYAEGITGYVSVYDVVNAGVMLMQSDTKNEQFVLVAENKSYKTIFLAIAHAFNKKPPFIKINKIMSALFWRIDYLISSITDKEPILTKNSAKSLHGKTYYSSEKIQNNFNFKFEQIDSTIHKVCKIYLAHL